MLESARNFIGKQCHIYTVSSMSIFSGVIKEVTDGALIIDNNKSSQIINLQYVISIQEVPSKKNTFKKSIDLD